MRSAIADSKLPPVMTECLALIECIVFTGQNGSSLASNAIYLDASGLRGIVSLTEAEVRACERDIERKAQQLNIPCDG